MNNISDQAHEARAAEESSTQQRAQMLGLKYLDSRGIIENAPIIKDLISVEDMYQLRAIPYQLTENSITFLITTKTAKQVLEKLKNRFPDYIVDFYVISDSGYKEYMARIDPPPAVEYEDIVISSEGDSQTLENVSRILEQVKADDILDYLITQADRLNASDIHFENEKNSVKMRFRIDGALHLIAILSKEKYKQLQSVLASRANISTNSQKPQTGRISKQLQGSDGSYKSLNMRIETIMTNNGQDVVIRIFNLNRSLLKLEKLGFENYQLANVEQIIRHPHGMAIVVGPTGSGKTTTLYSILDRLVSPQRKIITLEDPVEYEFENVTQVPVLSRKGETFADMLRAVLRFDPDVIMVGEIRDTDTARTALQSALTGHLVLSTFHAANAVAALTRMLDIIGENPLFANSIRMIIAQRLVRRLDDATKQPYEPDQVLKEQIIKLLNNLPDYVPKPPLDNIVLYRPQSTPESPFGYKGRIMVSEQLIVTPQLQALLRQDLKSISSDEIQKLAISQGMVTLVQDAMLKALSGLTSIEEVFRVVA